MNENERTAELKSLADAENAVFSECPNPEELPELQHFRSHSDSNREVLKVRNLFISGDLVSFDVFWAPRLNVSNAFGPLAYRDTSVDQIRQQSVVLYRAIQPELPQFHIIPAESVNLIERTLGSIFQRPKLDLPARFEKTWSVRCSDDRAVSALFGADLLRFYDRPASFYTYGSGQFLFLSSLNDISPVEEVGELRRSAKTLAGLLSSRKPAD